MLIRRGCGKSNNYGNYVGNMIQAYLFYSYRDHPGNAIKCNFVGQLKDIVAGGRRGPKKLYYQIVSFYFVLI